jgi:ABC-type glycerol-3-phosphate transport system substrate-binding protein|tara:strand:- start:5410 stop:5793 length:384 start_codon:yes stop_codon:yes gene_type:complete
MKWIVIAALAILTACTESQQAVTPIVIQSEPIDRPNLILPSVDRFTAKPVEWTIVTPDNVEQVFADMQARGEAPALFVVTERGYENIATNVQESLRIIIQQQAQIDGYRRYYVITDGRIQEHNTASH